jgi:thiol-disulfide isomerase/thioredoxin
LVAFVALAACSKNESTDEIPPATSLTVAPPELIEYPVFTMNDIDGNPREFAEWDGRHRLLNFWATWCAPCRREIPLLKEFQAEQGEGGVLIMGIAVDFPEDVARYAEAAEFNYPILVGQEDAMALAESSGIQFIAMPFTMIVSREGQLLSAYLGELHREQLDTISNTLARLDTGDLSVDAAKAELDLL